MLVQMVNMSNQNGLKLKEAIIISIQMAIPLKVDITH